MTRKFLSSLVLGLSITFSGAAYSKEVACTGADLFAQMRKEDPTTAAAIDKIASEQQFGNSLFWKVTKLGVEPSYVYGTMHMADPRVVSISSEAQSAFDASSTFAMEVAEILDKKAMAAKAIQLMKYTTYLDGTTLTDKMSKEQAAPVKDRLENTAGLPWSLGVRLKPWVVMGSISLPACEMARKKDGKPFLDLLLGQMAKKQKKKIVGLETLEDQMSAMASLPEDMMVTALVDTAKMGSKLDDMFETTISLYAKGQTGTIWAMMRSLGPNGLKAEGDKSGFAAFQTTIVDKRNITLADGSAKLIDKGGAFIAVGALHLPGEKGILNILAQRGYTVTVQ